MKDYISGKMAICRLCGYTSRELPSNIGICRECLRSYSSIAGSLEVHEKWRSKLHLPSSPPRSEDGLKCPICVNECRIREGERGFCGVICNVGNRLVSLFGSGYSLLHWYYDPLPTNCVADPVCPASTDRGYPLFTHVKGPEYGMYNLAVFYGGCNLDCLFCQNIEHKYMVAGYKEGRYTEHLVKLEDLVDAALSDNVSCICFFGGDPTPNIIYSIRFAKTILFHVKNRGIIKRICWETNGLVNPVFMRRMAELSRDSGGIVKVDWKAWSPSIYEALTGVDGYKAVERLKENVKLIYETGFNRDEPPILVVSILLVPHYIDYYEVYGIASYIAEISDSIPIVLLAFHPEHLMQDVPTTSWSQMNDAIKAVKDAGIKEYYIGNRWLLRSE